MTSAFDRLSKDDQARAAQDLAIYGRAVCVERDDGTVELLPPMKVLIAQAEGIPLETPPEAEK